MIFPITNFPVNWVDGMKISKDHFIDSDKHFTDLIRDFASVYVTDKNFGLLPPPAGTKNYPDLRLNSAYSGRAELSLNCCNALTSGGFRIMADFHQVDGNFFSQSFDTSAWSEDSIYDVLLVANPYSRQPKGTPSLEENPPRHPYTDISYRLEILPEERISSRELGPYHFVIGKLTIKHGDVKLLTDYIPPCAYICSHPELERFSALALRVIRAVQNDSFSIIRKVHEKNKLSSLAHSFTDICTVVLNYISSVYFQLTNEMMYLAPVQLVGCLSSLAGLIHTNLKTMHPEAREELLKYMYEWTEHTPGGFDQMLQKAVEITYDHHNIRVSLSVMQSFLQNMETIWNKMNALEFIGQRKENLVVTSEIVSQQTEQPKKRWSILD